MVQQWPLPPLLTTRSTELSKNIFSCWIAYTTDVFSYTSTTAITLRILIQFQHRLLHIWSDLMLHRTLTTALMSDGFNTTVNSLSKCVCLWRTLKRQTIAATARLPVMKCWRGTSVRQIVRQHTEQHQLNNKWHATQRWSKPKNTSLLSDSAITRLLHMHYTLTTGHLFHILQQLRTQHPVHYHQVRCVFQLQLIMVKNAGIVTHIDLQLSYWQVPILMLLHCDCYYCLDKKLTP